MKESGSDAGSVAAPLPQEQITMLLNKQDFNDKVCQDKSNLCCVLVTSTLCRQCGIRHIPYPKPPSRTAEDSTADGDDNGEGDGEDAAGELDEDGEEDGSPHDGNSAAAGHFYRDFETHLVRKAATVVQRRHVRFFHVCACAQGETCVDFLIAADPAYSVLNKKPTVHEMAQLHTTAHRQLHELLRLLEVRSTPQMRFYLAGQPLRYSMMATDMGGVTKANDVVMATGANWVKWARVLENAVVVRNAVMHDADIAEREQARLARAEAKRLAREARRRQATENDAEEEDDE
ncbi:hypothetical protein N2W54_003404 [Lotmaria passim]